MPGLRPLACCLQTVRRLPVRAVRPSAALVCTWLGVARLRSAYGGKMSGWRDVPMPRSIAGLPRALGGLPVPYVAQWSGEEEMCIRIDRYADNQRAVFPRLPDQRGRGKPVFGVMEPSRQREVVATMRCQVCHKPLPGITNVLSPLSQPLWLADMLREPLTFRGHKLSLEPWVCDDCMVYALQVCPALVGLLPAPVGPGKRPPLPHVLMVWTANLICTQAVMGGNLKRSRPAVSYLKIEPLRYARVEVPTFLRLGPLELRRRAILEGLPHG